MNKLIKYIVICVIFITNNAYAFDNTDFVTVGGYNGSAQIVGFYGNHNNNGYIRSNIVLLGQYSNNWLLPIGSYFCVFEIRYLTNNYVDVFKVVKSNKNTGGIEIYGSTIHSWLINSDNLEKVGYYDPEYVIRNYQSTDVMDWCRLGKVQYN